MYNIYFYEDSRGIKPVKEFIRELGSHSDKASRVRLGKLNDYIQQISEYGTRAGHPYVKHLDGEIWEIRPNRDRVLFAAALNNGFVLLHHFIKKTQKTPKREIDQAKRNLVHFKEVHGL